MLWNDDISGVLAGWVFASCFELQSTCKSDQMTFMALCRLSRYWTSFPKWRPAPIFESRNLSAKESCLLGMPAFPSEVLSRGSEQMGFPKMEVTQQLLDGLAGGTGVVPLFWDPPIVVSVEGRPESLEQCVSGGSFWGSSGHAANDTSICRHGPTDPLLLKQQPGRIGMNLVVSFTCWLYSKFLKCFPFFLFWW